MTPNSFGLRPQAQGGYLGSMGNWGGGNGMVARPTAAATFGDGYASTGAPGMYGELPAPTFAPPDPQAPGGIAELFAKGGLFEGALPSTTFAPNGAPIQNQGWGTPVLGAASGLLNAYMGMKQFGLAKDTLAEGKRQFGLNYDAQRTTTNSQLEDRQRARVSSNPGAYQSVGDYMAANSIKGG